MEIKIKGKAISKRGRMNRRGLEDTIVEVEEGELYKSEFSVTIPDTQLAAKVEVGKFYVFSGYGNGQKLTHYKNGLGESVPYKYPRHEIWLKVTKVEDMMMAKLSEAIASDKVDADIEDVI